MYVPHSRVPPNYTTASCGFSLTASLQCIESRTPEGRTQVSITTQSFFQFHSSRHDHSPLFSVSRIIQNGETRTDGGSPNKPSKNKQGVGIVTDTDWWVGGLAREQQFAALFSKSALSLSAFRFRLFPHSTSPSHFVDQNASPFDNPLFWLISEVYSCLDSRSYVDPESL